MELSSGSPISQDYLKSSRGQRSCSNSPLSFYSAEAETIDISKINFENDESWLCSSNTNQDCVTNVEDWLYNSNSLVSLCSSSGDLQKNIDTRTFTRPKKRFSRPSIEQFNDLYASSSATITIDSDSRSYIIEEKSETDISKPYFDLTQPSSSYYFEKMVADSEEADSFVNMSPPSLVNSMCSSTFANLMESSFIKNDPVLREIRDADYSDSVLLQDSETPMMQSIESCSSLNSDSPESFLKKISFNGTFKKNVKNDGDSYKNSNITHNKSCEDGDYTLTNHIENDQNNQTYINPNGTYRRTPKYSHTFTKSDKKKSQILLQSTFEVLTQEKLHSNRTDTLIQDCGSLEDIKRNMSEPIKTHTDLNRLSYCLENDVKLDMTYNDVNRTTNLKSSVLSGSVGSADSLDRLSSISDSSRGSNKMLNMADVDAIVEMQERHLQQVMSTPKPASAPKILWDNNLISPIDSQGVASDSDVSSLDDYKSVKSNQSSKTSLDGYMSNQSPRSMNYVPGPVVDTKIKINQKSSYAVVAPKPMAAIRSQIQNTKINTHSNLRNSNIPGSTSNLYKLSHSKAPPAPVSNLKAMGPKLKGSYTSLKPISSVLPVAPPLVGNLNETTIVVKSGHQNAMHTLEGGTRIVEVKALPKEKPVVVDETFIKPTQPKPSSLPRPSSIPRPSTTSRIPGPRSSNSR